MSFGDRLLLRLEACLWLSDAFPTIFLLFQAVKHLRLCNSSLYKGCPSPFQGMALTALYVFFESGCRPFSPPHFLFLPVSSFLFNIYVYEIVMLVPLHQIMGRLHLVWKGAMWVVMVQEPYSGQTVGSTESFDGIPGNSAVSLLSPHPDFAA